MNEPLPFLELLPPCRPASPPPANPRNIPLPSPPTCPRGPRRPRACDAVTDARAAAVAAISNGQAKYTAANSQLDLDVSDYDAAIEVWNQVNEQMPQNVYTHCLTALNAASAAQEAEADYVAASYGHLGAADSDLAAGDAAQAPMQKIAYYGWAKSHGDGAADAADDADSAHTGTFAPQLALANADLENYG